MNRVTKKWWEGEAFTAQDAVERTGWPNYPVWVREYSPKGCGGWKKPIEKEEVI